jgi:hypothetical protein
MIFNTERIRKTTFRTFLISLFASFGYDILWVIIVAGSYQNDQSAGGLESGIMKFSLYMTYISIIFRVSEIFFLKRDYSLLLYLCFGKTL